MRKIKLFVGLLFFITTVFFLFPGKGYAVEFEITNFTIHAQLLENGNAEVKETLTYSFDGDFNGITRTLIPKEGSKITKLRAEENGKALKVEKDGNLYHIHRKGTDENLSIDLFYTIENAVKVYEDVGDFYWPFFSKENESDFEKFTVTVYPPEETNDVIAYGTDKAFGTESVKADGVVIFNFGKVPSGKNGDIRVAYDATLFPAAKKIPQQMKAEIAQAKQDLLDKAAAWEERRELFQSIGSILLPAVTIVFLLLTVMLAVKGRLRKEAARRNVPDDFFVPQEKLPLAATIRFINKDLSSQSMSAAFLDLVRRGIVNRTGTENDRFRIAGSTEHLQKAEQHLLTFLFDEVGKNGEFSFSDLKAYMKKRENHQTYYQFQQKWRSAVKEDVYRSSLFEKITGYRVILGLCSLLLLPFLVIFVMYDLPVMFIGALVLTLYLGGSAIFYLPKSFEGWTVYYEWTALKERLKYLPEETWQSLTESDQMLVYLFALGTNSNRFANLENIKGYFELPPDKMHPQTQVGMTDNTNMAMMLYIGPLATTNFHSAERTAQNTLTSTTSSGSTSNFGGGSGIGGGGGGAGAF